MAIEVEDTYSSYTTGIYRSNTFSVPATGGDFWVAVSAFTNASYSGIYIWWDYGGSDQSRDYNMADNWCYAHNDMETWYDRGRVTLFRVPETHWGTSKTCRVQKNATGSAELHVKMALLKGIGDVSLIGGSNLTGGFQYSTTMPANSWMLTAFTSRDHTLDAGSFNGGNIVVGSAGRSYLGIGYDTSSPQNSFNNYTFVVGCWLLEVPPTPSTGRFLFGSHNFYEMPSGISAPKKKIWKIPPILTPEPSLA